MTPVFISYDRRDKYFVHLLEALLDHEGVESWCDRDRIAAGDHYQQRIQEGLQTSKSLLTVVSQNAVQSKWVTAEVLTFCTARQNPVVIPIVIDQTAPAAVLPSLEAYHAIDMTQDMLQGFVSLCSRFGRNFLSGQEQRRNGERRESKERRQNPLRRLRTGLWQSYASVTGAGKFDSVDFARATQRARIASALEPEILKYELLDETHRQIDSRWALQRALEAIARESAQASSAQGGSNEGERAVYLMEKVAAHLYEHYEVRSKDRREGHERRLKT